MPVIYRPNIVHLPTTPDIFYTPHHPYTNPLLQSLPTLHIKHHLIPIQPTPPHLFPPPNRSPYTDRSPPPIKICH
ncbi:ABC transporter ATP-binding protein, partial [Bacillus pumilus]